jgi:hypothetical protein
MKLLDDPRSPQQEEVFKDYTPTLLDVAIQMGLKSERLH